MVILRVGVANLVCLRVNPESQPSIYEHNSYTAAINIIFQNNRYVPLRTGAGGNGLKDRSAGLVVRYNWLEGGNRQLDLVDGEDSSIIRNDPTYRQTHVYGNVLIENAGDGNRQMVHYGGDSGNTGSYRKGTLFFYNNTVVSYRTDRTTLFRLSTNSETCDARNSIFYATAAGNTVSLLDVTGVLNLSRNWIKPGWVTSVSPLQRTVNNDGTMVETASPRGSSTWPPRTSTSPLHQRGRHLEPRCSPHPKRGSPVRQASIQPSPT